MMKKAVLIYMILIISAIVNGQDISLTAEYPAVVVEGQQFNITFNVNSGGGEFSAPAFTGFYKLMGPQTSYSSSTRIENGKMTRQTSYSYTYFLQALKEGKYTLNPAVFTLKNQAYTSDSIHIEVIGNASQQQVNPQGGNNITDKPDMNSGGGDVFVNLSLNRKEIFLGEHVAATIKIYTRVNLSGINEIKFPAFNSFLKSDIATPPLTSLREENVNGTIYGTGVVQQFLLYPQVTGEITIDPVQITVLTQQKSGQSDPFFGDFFTSYQTVPKSVASQQVKIKVKPLPGIKPIDFSGIVGMLDLKASLNKDSVNVNDAVTLKITISGSGNLKIAEVPQLKLSPDIEIYDPRIYDDIKIGVNGATGQKTFEYLLIPRHYGEFTIPPVTYSYFDTSKGTYVKLSTPEFHFYARKGGDQNSGLTVYGGVSKEDVRYLGKDVRFIKTNPGRLVRTGTIIIKNRSFYSAYVFSIFIFLLVLFIRREHIRRNSDHSIVRNRKAGKIAARRLRSASACLKNNQLDMFHDEILKAIWGYLSDKLSIPVSELTRNRAISALSERGIDDERITSLTSILDACEYARYAPLASGTEAASIYEGSTQFIKSVENSIE